MKAENIKALRKSMGLTQEDFAHRIGVTFATVNRWENNKAVPSKLALRVLEKIREESGQ